MVSVLPAVRHMERKQHIDLFGAIALTAFALHLAFNQVVIKVTVGGFSPAFAAGLRSLGAVFVLLLWMHLRGISWQLPRPAWAAGLLVGVLFAVEFVCLFTAVDLTTVSRVSVIFYSMPVWLALAAHFLLPQERLTKLRALGLALALGGVALAMSNRSGGQGGLAGDVLSLIAAWCWAGVALAVRLTRLSQVSPAQQLLVQLFVSAPILLIAAPFFGPLVKDVQPIHVAGLLFQIVAVASLGFLVWFWLLSIYPAASVASFSFLSPVFAVLLGWLLLSEVVNIEIWVALAMVAAGIYLVNRRPRGG